MLPGHVAHGCEAGRVGTLVYLGTGRGPAHLTLRWQKSGEGLNRLADGCGDLVERLEGRLAPAGLDMAQGEGLEFSALGQDFLAQAFVSPDTAHRRSEQ